MPVWSSSVGDTHYDKDDPFCATALAGKLPIEDTLAIEHAANHACIATPGECIIFSELV
jgi:hypothetical protein